MADQLQIRGGDTTSNSTFTGAQRELSIDTTKNQLIVHDGATPGGHPVPSSDAPEFTGAAEFGGSAGFAGTVKQGTFNGGQTTTNGSVLLDNGGVYTQILPSSTSDLYRGYKGSSLVFNVKADGGASFASTLEADELAVYKPTTTPSASILRVFSDYGGTLALKFNVKADGSATFTGPATFYGRIDTGNGFNSYSNKTGPMFTLKSENGDTTRYIVNNDGTTKIGGTLPSAPKISLNANGNASFAGDVTAGNFFTTTATGALLSHTGTVMARQSSSNGVLWQGLLNNTQTSQIAAGGNASFAGTVSAQGTVLTSDRKFKTNIETAGSQLSDVVQLGNLLKKWDWKEDAPVADKEYRFLGLIAQEAEEVSPGIVKTIARTKQGAELTPQVVVPAVYETRTVPAVLDDEGVVVEAETTEEVLVTAEQITPATYEELDDSYKGISHDALLMKLLGAVAELKAEIEELNKV